MASLHQSHAPTALWHTNQYTLVIDPPGQSMACVRFQTLMQANAASVRIPHSYVLYPFTKK